VNRVRGGVDGRSFHVGVERPNEIGQQTGELGAAGLSPPIDIGLLREPIDEGCELGGLPWCSG
jgi:hypothetical protein